MQTPDGSVSRYMYDETGNLQMYSNAEGNTSVYVYKDNVLKAVVEADGTSTSYKDDEGLIKAVINNKGQETLLDYDRDHNLVYMKLPDNAEARWEYDAWGRCITSINPENQSQQFNYDLLDRVIQIRKYDGNKVRLKYNAYAEVVHVEDAHHKIKFEYTPLGSLKLREENGTLTRFNYNTEEQLISLLNEHNEVYHFKYDANGRVIEEKGFDGLKRQFIRDRAGKIIRVIRPGNRFTEYAYDLAGNLVRAEYSDGSWEVRSYNKEGKLIEAQNENNKIVFERDAAGRILKEMQEDYSVISKYDTLGKRIEVKSSLGAFIKIERNEAGFVNRMDVGNNEGINWAAQFKYNALGLETERLLPGGIVAAFQYDRAGHPVDHSIKNSSRNLRHRIYSWNVNDRLNNMVNGLTRGIVQFGHDDLGNLAWAKYEDNKYDYRMPDKGGNLYKTKERDNRKYGAGGRLIESEGTKYNYDEDGNLVSKILPGGKQWIYQWAGNGMLKKVIRPDGMEVSFEYDALRRRTVKIYNGIITRWVWDGNIPLHEWKYELKERPVIVLDELGEVSKDKEEPCDGLTTWVFDEGTIKPAAKLQCNKFQSIVTDYLGTPVEMLDAEGNQTWSMDYDIYGKIKTKYEGKESDCPFRYQGQYEDDETGLYYNRFRYYDCRTGAYISQDPIGLAGNNPNLYAHVTDTNNSIDPFGLDCLKPEPGYLRGKKHGIKQQDSDAIKMAKDGNTPIGRWGSKDDLTHAGQQAATLQPGEMRDFPINPGHTSTVFNPDGTQSVPDMIRVRNNGNGTFHGFPINSGTAGPIVQ
jgi:RHS repeat-associated protein